MKRTDTVEGLLEFNESDRMTGVLATQTRKAVMTALEELVEEGLAKDMRGRFAPHPYVAPWEITRRVYGTLRGSSATVRATNGYGMMSLDVVAENRLKRVLDKMADEDMLLRFGKGERPPGLSFGRRNSVLYTTHAGYDLMRKRKEEQEAATAAFLQRQRDVVEAIRNAGIEVKDDSNRRDSYVFDLDLVEALARKAGLL